MTTDELREALGPDPIRGTTGADTVERVLAGSLSIEDAKNHALHLLVNKAARRAVSHDGPTHGVLDPAALRAQHA